MIKLGFAALVAVCAFAVSVGPTVTVAGETPNAIKISHAWVRPMPPGAPTAAGYLTITNTGKVPDRLIGASSPAAEKVEIHRTSMTGGIMRMRPVPGGIVVPVDGSVIFDPGGYHLMFAGPKRMLKVGDRVPVTLKFQHADSVMVEFRVEQPAAGPGQRPGMAMPAGAKRM